MTTAEYLARFDRDYGSAEHVAINRRIGQGNTLSNIAEVYPDAVFVEFHLPGEGEMADFSWSSVRVVLEWLDGDGVVSDQWTI